VARHVVTDPAWRRAHEELRQVDDAMDALTVPPCPSDLPGRIVVRTTGGSFDWEQLRRTLLSAPAAVAAIVAVLLAIYALTTVWSGPQGIAPTGVNNQAQVTPDPSSDAKTQTVRDVVEEELAGYDRVEQFAIMNREMIENYAVIENLDVLREMERIESEGDS
jgi:anti-sigma factor RsiW